MAKSLPSIIGELDINLINGVPLPIHLDITELVGGGIVILTGYTAIFQIRPSVEDENPALVELLEPADITIGAAGGTVDFTIPAQSFENDSLVWGLQLINGSGVPDIIIGGVCNSEKAAVQ